ncbi:MAG: prepilin-type N-terminal cleavage/methylation domain-containing protein [bacterium]|nr:prepilin-type N-terminal cleavage/methylation domain-containing protein [bacterium]MDZ4284938.1 prepilin-type N-terminal cleavage/methylation domain-containing protein [Patescibacteria group bacterium]
MMNIKNGKRGFTLIELLVVIAIIGILSGVVLASLQSARERARNATRISDVRQVVLALELYFDANSGYPIAAMGDDVPDILTMQGYLSQEPKEPVAGRQAYRYVAITGNAGYCFGVDLEGTPSVPKNNDPQCLSTGMGVEPNRITIAAIDYAVSP